MKPYICLVTPDSATKNSSKRWRQWGDRKPIQRKRKIHRKIGPTQTVDWNLTRLRVSLLSPMTHGHPFLWQPIISHLCIKHRAWHVHLFSSLFLNSWLFFSNVGFNYVFMHALSASGISVYAPTERNVKPQDILKWKKHRRVELPNRVYGMFCLSHIKT